MASYRPLRAIARGGMGRVDLAVREAGEFMRFYAVKRLRAGFIDDPDARAMFLEEARVAGLVRHPNVVAVHDVGEDAEGPYLVMDFVEGMSLSSLLDWVKAEGSLLPVQVCLRIMRDVAEGLHAAHELRGPDDEALGLVHRDVSPQNILVGFDGIVRLTDFGIAKALGRSTAQTSTGLVKGKSGYLAPEQLKFKEPDRRTDLFAMGIVFYELMSGERLYAGKSLGEVAERILEEPPPDIFDVRDDVPANVVGLLFKLLAKSPDGRPRDARSASREIDEALHALLSNEEPVALSDFMDQHFRGRRIALRGDLDELWKTHETRAARWRGPRRRFAWIAALTVALALAGVGAAAATGAFETELEVPAARATREIAPTTPAAVVHARTAEVATQPSAAEVERAGPEIDEPARPRPRRQRTKRAPAMDMQGQPFWEWQE
jgi:eukaryotic-like serine/threonine-protein kinase